MADDFCDPIQSQRTVSYIRNEGRKTTVHRHRERNSELRDQYLHKLLSTIKIAHGYTDKIEGSSEGMRKPFFLVEAQNSVGLLVVGLLAHRPPSCFFADQAADGTAMSSDSIIHEDTGPLYSKRVECGSSRHAGLSESLLVSARLPFLSFSFFPH